MRRKSLYLMMALTLVLVSMSSLAFAAGSWIFEVQGGAGLPTGDLADEAKGNAQTGYQLGGAVDYRVNDMFAVGVDGSWVHNKNDFEGQTVTFDFSDIDPTLGSVDVKFDKLEYNTIQFGARAKYMLPMQGGPITPYGLVGLGVYSTTLKIEATEQPSGPSFSDDFKFDSRFGGKVGVGATYKATNLIGIGLEADYNFISEDKEKAGFDSGTYIGVKGHVTFNMTPAAK